MYCTIHLIGSYWMDSVHWFNLWISRNFWLVLYFQVFICQYSFVASLWSEKLKDNSNSIFMASLRMPMGHKVLEQKNSKYMYSEWSFLVLLVGSNESFPLWKTIIELLTCWYIVCSSTENIILWCDSYLHFLPYSKGFLMPATLLLE